MRHPVEVDHLVDEDVGVAGEPNEVVTGPGVTGEDHGAFGRVEPEGQSGEHRSVLHEDRLSP